MAREPAAIRYKNPGAMWPGPTASKWGSKRWIYLNDGTGQGGGGRGNKIAIFDNWVDGICAQMDLWRTSPRYKNKKFKDAIAVWSGGNHVASYIAYVKARVPGMDENTIMDDAFWRGPMAIPFLKAQSGHEAGKPIPAPDADWIEAQKRVFTGVIPPAPKPAPKPATVAKKSTPPVVAGGSAAGAAHQSGLSIGWVIGIGVAVALAAFLIIHFWPKKR